MLAQMLPSRCSPAGVERSSTTLRQTHAVRPVFLNWRQRLRHPKTLLQMTSCTSRVYISSSIDTQLDIPSRTGKRRLSVIRWIVDATRRWDGSSSNVDNCLTPKVTFAVLFSGKHGGTPIL